MKYIYYLLLLSLVYQCTADEQGESNIDDEEAVVQDYTPEEVVRHYQHHLDQNEFEQAKQFSTAAEQAHLTEIADIIMEESADSTVFTTHFVSINCEIEDESAVCDCVIEYENSSERFTDTFYLVRQNGRWLKDRSEEEINYDYNEEVEQFLEDEIQDE